MNSNVDKPRIVTLCGSTKFKDEFLKVQKEFTLSGHIVLNVGFYHHKDNIEITHEQKCLLDNLHKRKIDISDMIFVINVGGYIGESTKSEIKYAQEHGVAISYLECPFSDKDECACPF